MTEQQRIEALAACDRIIKSHNRAHRQISEGIEGLIETFKEMARICNQKSGERRT